MDTDGREYLQALNNLGAPICIKLKNIYFSEIKWPDCYKEVANKFTQIKRIARKLYADKEELAMLKELARYSQDDIKDMAESELVAQG